MSMADSLPPLPPALEGLLRRIPAVRRAVDSRIEEALAPLDEELHPYRGRTPAHRRLPVQPLPQAALLAELEELAALEAGRWRAGQASGAVYHGAAEHVAFLNQAYALHSQSNPLHGDLWPSATKFEAEIVAMTAHMLGGGPEAGADGAERPGAEQAVVGAVTSGGTESILLAMKAYRDRGRAERGIRRPEIVAPVTAHTAFDKAAHYFGLKLVKVPVLGDGRADVEAARRAVSRRTVALVGSAPCFPYGAIDPISELADLAQSCGLGLHVDACLGGFVLPWAARLGADVPPFDFRLPGVTSMSADTHKYGYAAKGVSTVLYRGEALRRRQYFAAADWPGGLYASPTLAGSRPGGLSAAAWAAMLAMGEEGYLEATRRILAAAYYIRRGVEAVPELHILGNPLFVVAFTSDTLDIYAVLDQMARRGWSLNGLHRPPAVHLAVTLRHAQPGVAQRFVEDLHAAVAHVRAHPGEAGGMAPIYGMAAGLPLRGVVAEVLKRYMDLAYRV